MSISRFTAADAAWVRFGDAGVYIGNVLHERNSTSMGGGFACFLPEAAMTWTPSYDEVIVVRSGEFTVDSETGSTTAGPGELVWVKASVPVTFRAGREKTWIAFATYPIWDATPESKAQAAALQPVDGPPAD
ncbi:hypothetical protein [Nocardiopsis lambiniae]|uniref:Cupin domain-containing protein n=1 Tax=Nocardiopsis lambiniae TaxID=3075539 RepID=A0ABU2MBV4_9ACTN|nr:hypothetical protein [Nocardiopsis sp. DSM 44743]MDT0330164.1 hypothetical protein [Nocardiopsis sp. DSM 44743]